MSEETRATAAKAPGAPSPASADLSDEIICTIEKRPDDRVTCRRVSGSNYRCNWWAAANKNGYDNPRMEGLLVTTHRVRLSRFLTVTKTAEGLRVKDWAPAVGLDGA